jgi:Mg-chelatase subunit ChlD
MASKPKVQTDTMLNVTKFALHNFKGTPVRYFKVESDDLASKAVTEVRKPSHHILVVDRSGSMYGDIPSVRTTLEKLLTLSEFKDPSLKVSLISYSSQGDVKLHFSKVTVEDVMATNSPYVKEIRSLQATCMTCISQGLVMAETLVDDADTTAITLHTDGYANDRSPMQEQVAIKAVIGKLQKHPGVFCNTIGYREWCDYNLLASIANSLSGVCLQAKGVKDVFESVYNTTKLLAGTVAPAVEVAPGTASHVLFVSRSARKVLGAKGATLVVKGLNPTDDKVAYRLTEVSAKDYAALNAPINGDTAPVEPILAFARTLMAQGELNASKYAMVASRCGELLTAHARALVPSDIAAMAGDMETRLFDRVPFVPSTGYGLPSTGPSVLRVLTFLNDNADKVMVNLTDLAAGYKRRGVKRIPGTRLPDGTVEEPTVFSKVRAGGDGWVKVNGFELNRNTATVNMLVSQQIDLFPKGGNTRIASVAGVNLDSLRSYNNYTLVGDGMLNVQALNLRTSDQKVIDGLLALGAPVGAAKAGQPFSLALGGLPLVDYDLNVTAVDKPTVQRLAQLTVLGKILSGMVKGDPSGFTPEQVTDLKAHYLTPALYFSPPTTTSYAKLEDAIAKGEVDTKLSYKVDLGTPELTNLGKLKSGNEYLQRRFTLQVQGKDIDKPTLDYLLMPGSVWGIKKLTGRTVLDAVDDVSYPIYEGVLGLGAGTELKALLKSVGCVDPDRFLADLKGAGARDAVKDATRFVDDAIEAVYQTLRPLAFFVGATGMVPDSLGSKVFTADEFTAAYPNAKLAKAEKEEGSFFMLPDGTVLTVYVKGELYSTCPASP